ncbi:alpha/beta-hydrolase [Trametes elegans]|nr:alpha/beta-hydrolase [Trametes elegans]
MWESSSRQCLASCNRDDFPMGSKTMTLTLEIHLRKMPTAPVNDDGTVLYYEDSGVPAKSTDYITIVLVHGTCFHGAIYRPLLPFAAERNLRLVFLNQRGYPGSSTFTSEDVEGLRGSSDEQGQVMRDRGLEIAEFLRWFIETASIPPIKTTPDLNASTGGISLLAWSGGTMASTAMLAHADKLSEGTQKLLSEYIRSFVMYDPSGFATGQPLPPGLSTLKIAPSLSVDVQLADFALSVASYYPPYTLNEGADLPTSFDPPRTPLVGEEYTPTTSKMAPGVLASLTQAPLLELHQHLIWSVSRDVFRENTERALLDCRLRAPAKGSGERAKVWPDLPVHVVWCEMTVGECLWGVLVIRHRFEHAKAEHRRILTFHKLADANHFLHWENPERFVQFLAGIV